MTFLKSWTKRRFELRGNALDKRLDYAILILLLAWIIIESMATAVNLPTFHLDGAFQTASGLYRLHAGQHPGQDFLPYLGVGPLYLLWPVFEIFGANLAASVVAAKLVTLLSGCVAVSLLVHWTFASGQSFRRSLVWGGASFLLMLALGVCLFGRFPEWLEFYTTAGNSLRPIRAIAPYLTVVVAYGLLRREGPIAPRRYVVLGAVAGVAALWSNDFAFLAICALGGYVLGADGLERRLSIKNFLLMLISAFAVWWSVAFMLTNGHYDELLAYNFQDVLHDQWWYFAPYSEEHRVFSVSDLRKLLASDFYRAILSLLISAYLLIRYRKHEYLAIVMVAGALMGGGLLASVGGHIDRFGYFKPAAFLCNWLVLLLLLRVVRARTGRLSESVRRRYPMLGQLVLAHRVRGAGRLAVLVTMTAFAASNALSMTSKMRRAEHDARRFFVPELGGYLREDWKPYVELARANKNAVVIEEYWGLWSAINRVFPPWPVDSAIHALGHIRNRAADAMGRADFVITTRYEMSPPWQPWNLSTNYWLYRPLIDSYEQFSGSPNTLVWRKTAERSIRQPTGCKIGDDRRSFTLDGGHGFYEVALDYSFDGPRRTIILVRNNISFGVDSRGYLSIDPAARMARFPVYLASDSHYRFDLRTIGSNGELRVKTCTAQKINNVDEGIYRASEIGRQWRWEGCQLPSEVGRYAEDECTVATNGSQKSGAVSFGPYISLPAGRYHFRIRYDSPVSADYVQGDWDVFLPLEKEGNTLASGPVIGTKGEPADLTGYFVIETGSEFSPVEIRVFGRRRAQIRITSITLERVSPL